MSGRSKLEPFLEMAAKGCISGKVSEWPQLVPACKYAVTRIAELEKEIAKLKIMKSGELRDWVLRLENNVENLLEKNAELEASLKKYGRHISDGLAFEIAGHTDGACPSSVDRGECVCGFDKDLKPDQRGGEKSNLQKAINAAVEAMSENLYTDECGDIRPEIEAALALLRPFVSGGGK